MPWSSVALSKTQTGFALNKTIMSSAQFAPVKVVAHTAPIAMREPAPGVYVFDFGQNGPGWCRLRITGPAGLRVQLRHAEVLQHPPYVTFGSFHSLRIRIFGLCLYLSTSSNTFFVTCFVTFSDDVLSLLASVEVMYVTRSHLR